jgi:hypothetical protein
LEGLKVALGGMIKIEKNLFDAIASGDLQKLETSLAEIPALAQNIAIQILRRGLVKAASKDFDKIVDRLLKIDMLLKDVAALHVAVEATTNTAILTQLIDVLGEALLSAVREHNLSKVERLLKIYDLRDTDDVCFKALECAYECDYKDIACYLLENSTAKHSAQMQDDKIITYAYEESKKRARADEGTSSDLATELENLSLKKNAAKRSKR